MLNLELPMVFILLPLPLLAFWLLPKAKQQQAAVRVPFYSGLSDLQHKNSNNITQRKLRLFSLVLIWSGLIAAASGPIWIGDAISLPASGRDLLLAVDLSGSMKREDMKVRNQTASRIIAVKAVLNDFIERRKGDRLGLVVFGTQAYVQAPLTFDRVTVNKFLKEAQIGFAGEEQTAIGDAIGLSVKRLKDRPGDRHVMVLLTDGQNNGGAIQPLQAAKLAADNDIIIYTIGVGADEMIVPGIFGSRRVNPSADLDETTLQEIARITGGQYFRARNPEELINIYRLLDELEPVEDNKETFRPQKALFYWPLGAALLLSAYLSISLLPWRFWLMSLKHNHQGDMHEP
jgi:Ca-activated chloride channel family protein